MKKGEIKFRAWDGEKMYYPIVFEFGVNNRNGETSIAFEYNGGMLTTSYIMQYTGLKDKNGMEIYEGDIVAKFDFEDPYFRSEVERRLGAFGYVSDGDFIAFSSNYHFMWTNGKSDKIVVIGNIYESPELLVVDNKGKEQTAKQ